MTDVELYIWDVKRGDAMLVKGPEENAIIDVGSSDFSPTEHIADNHGVDDIGFLLISHPDEDHISDIVTFFDEFHPDVLRRPKSATPYIEHRKENIYPNNAEYQKIAGKYLEINDRYSSSVSTSPSSEDRNEGLIFKSYSHDPEDVGIPPASELGPNDDPNLNDLSFLTVVEYGDFKLLTMGDLEEDAIEQFLEKSYVRSRIQDTDVLTAPHHGLNSSYASELFEYITPDIVAISDAGGTDASASGKYSNRASGKWVERRNGSNRERSIISTRDDGVLYFGIEVAGSYKVIID